MCTYLNFPGDVGCIDGATVVEAVSRGKSKYRGVSWNASKMKWRAQIYLNGKNTYLGWFESEEEAARKYDEYAALRAAGGVASSSDLDAAGLVNNASSSNSNVAQLNIGNGESLNVHRFASASSNGTAGLIRSAVEEERFYRASSGAASSDPSNDPTKSTKVPTPPTPKEASSLKRARSSSHDYFVRPAVTPAPVYSDLGRVETYDNRERNNATPTVLCVAGTSLNYHIVESMPTFNGALKYNKILFPASSMSSDSYAHALMIRDSDLTRSRSDNSILHPTPQRMLRFSLAEMMLRASNCLSGPAALSEN